MDKEKNIKKEIVDNQEDFILKKIRYYQGTIDDYETFWNKKAAEGEKEECPETKSFAKRNAELNKAFEIVPVEKDETVLAKDIVSGKDVYEKPSDTEEGDKSEKKDGEKVEDKKKKKEEKTVKGVKKEEKGEDEKKNLKKTN